MKHDTSALLNSVTCFKNHDVIKNFDDVISHQSEIKKFQVFGFFIIFIQPNDMFQTKDYVFYVFVASVKLSDRKALWDDNRKHHNFNITLVSYRCQLQEK